MHTHVEHIQAHTPFNTHIKHMQACHDLVPPEDIVPLLKNIANAFVAGKRLCVYVC